MPLNSEVAACGSVLPSIPSKCPVLASGTSEIEFATPAIAIAVWPDPQVARFVSSVCSVVAVIDVARLSFPQLAIAAVVSLVAFTFARAFILFTHRSEDGFAVRTTVMLRANCRGECRAAVKVCGRNARAAVALAGPRLPRGNGRFRCVGAILGRSITLLAEAVTAVAGRRICLGPFDGIDEELSHTRVIRKRLLNIGNLVLAMPLRTSCDAESRLVVLREPLPFVIVHATAILAAACTPSSWTATV